MGELILTDRAAAEREPGYLGWDEHGARFAAPEEPAGPVLGPARMAAAMATAAAPWWPEADNRIQRAGVDGGSMVDGYKPKGLGHTTETSAWPSYSTNFYPHVTMHVVNSRFHARGHIRHDRAARALRNLAGGVQTNRGGPRQVEIVGRVDHVEVHGLPAALEDGIGRYAAWLEAEWGVRRVFEVRTKPYPDSYGLSNGLRLSAAAWAAYDGWLTHANAPENTHGDTGALNWRRILGGEDMALDADDRQWLARLVEDGCRRAVHAIMTGNIGLWATDERPGWEWYTPEVRAGATRHLNGQLGAIAAQVAALAEQVAALAGGTAPVAGGGGGGPAGVYQAAGTLIITRQEGAGA